MSGPDLGKSWGRLGSSLWAITIAHVGIRDNATTSQVEGRRRSIPILSRPCDHLRDQPIWYYEDSLRQEAMQPNTVKEEEECHEQTLPAGSARFVSLNHPRTELRPSRRIHDMPCLQRLIYFDQLRSCSIIVWIPFPSWTYQ